MEWVHSIDSSRKKFWNWSFLLFTLKVLVVQLCPTVCNTMGFSLLGSYNHGKLQERQAGCHSIFQGIFQTQGLNPCLLHCRWILYHLSYQGSLFFTLQNSVSLRISKTWLKKRKEKKRKTLPQGYELEDFVFTYFIIYFSIQTGST